MKIVKIILITSMILILFMGVGIFLFLKTFNINAYKDRIVARVSAVLGQDVRVDSMAFQLSLNKGARLTIQSLSILEKGGDFPWIKAQELRLYADIRKLITDRKISAIKVVGENIQLRWPIDKKKVSSLYIKDCVLEASQIAMNKDIPFTLRASVAGKRQNIFLEGTVHYMEKTGTWTLKETKAYARLDDFDMERFSEAFGFFKEFGIREPLQGRFVFIIQQMRMGAEGIRYLRASGELEDGRLKTDKLAYPIENIDIRFHLTEKDAVIDEVFLYLASGRLQARARIRDYWQQQHFSFDVDFEDIQLKELMASQSDWPVVLEGRLFGRIEGEGTGFHQENWWQQWRGVASLEVKQGLLKELNVLNHVMGYLNRVSGLVQGERRFLSDSYEKALAWKDTRLDKLFCQIRMEKKVLFLTTGELKTRGVTVLAKGRLTWDQDLSLETDILMDRDLSQRLVSSVTELAGLLDEKQRLRIPMRPYQGKLGNIRIYPDLEVMGKRLLKRRGKQELKKVLRKALDIEEKTVEEKSEQEQPQPEEIFIDSIFEAIFQ